MSNDDERLKNEVSQNLEILAKQTDEAKSFMHETWTRTEAFQREIRILQHELRLFGLQGFLLDISTRHFELFMGIQLYFALLFRHVSKTMGTGWDDLNAGELINTTADKAAEMSEEDRWGHVQSCEEATGIPPSVLETVLDILLLLRNWDYPQRPACTYNHYRDAMGDLISRCREDKCDVTDPDTQCLLLQCVQQVWERVNALVREGRIVP